MESDTVVLITSDGARVAVSKAFVAMSGVLSAYEDRAEIDVPKVSKLDIDLIAEYLDYHCYMAPRPITKPLSSERIEDAVEYPWDAEFVNRLEECTLIDLANASNYLDVACVFDLCCAKIATLFKGKKVEELKERYNIQEDLTPEMEEQILKENPWITSDSANP